MVLIPNENSKRTPAAIKATHLLTFFPPPYHVIRMTCSFVSFFCNNMQKVLFYLFPHNTLPKNKKKIKVHFFA